MPLVIIKEFESESVIKGYHDYMNNWTPILGESLHQHVQNPKTKLVNKLWLLLKTHGGLAIWRKERLVDTLKLFFTSYELTQWTPLVLLPQGKGLTLEMDKDYKFSAQFYSGEKKYVEVLKKYLNLFPL